MTSSDGISGSDRPPPRVHRSLLTVHHSPLTVLTARALWLYLSMLTNFLERCRLKVPSGYLCPDYEYTYILGFPSQNIIFPLLYTKSN